MKKLLHFYPVASSFVKSDEQLLSGAYTVKSFFFNGSIKVFTPYYFIAQLLFLLIHLSSADKMVSQFSGYHSFLPALASRIFKCPHFIILHGTECNNFPEFRYGYLLRPLLFWFSKKSLAWSTKLLPVSKALVSADYTYTDTKYTKQGFRNFYPGIITPYEIINNGVSPGLFNIGDPNDRSQNSFITVAAGLNSPVRRTIKGIDMVIELARLTPEYSYTIIGATGPLDLALPSNLVVLNYIPNDQLRDYYNKHAFYLQLSVSEGFVISVCEAMLCGCIPIVSNVGASPDIAGPVGYVLKRKNIDGLVQLVRQAVEEFTPTATGLARKHIVSNFTLYERKKRLLAALEN